MKQLEPVQGSSRRKRLCATGMVALQIGCAAALLSRGALADDDRAGATTTPIKHVIVIIGENRTFDHLFATYKPVRGQTVDNLLSKGIVDENGQPGPNFVRLGGQYEAQDTGKYSISPGSKTLYTTLPRPGIGGPALSYLVSAGQANTLANAQLDENGLAVPYSAYLLSGGTGGLGPVDLRIGNYAALPPGPFPLTGAPGSLTYDDYAGSPVHRFYQMWQQLDCNVAYASPVNPSGCKSDLFPWVETSVGAGSNGAAQPAGFTGKAEGSTAMGFYNVLKGDMPYFKELADNFAMSDNYHQAVMGGTGANHVMLGTGDAIWFSDGAGHAAVPPHGGAPAPIGGGTLDEIENPDPVPGTNNWYTQDGYGGFTAAGASYGGGTYSNCADETAPGVASVLAYLRALPRPVDPNCEAGHYYLLNNYNPGYYGDGTNAYTDTSAKNTPFTIPPSSLRNIGDALLEKGVSFAYFGDQFNNYLASKFTYTPVGSADGDGGFEYCNICNFLQYSTSIMTNAPVRQRVLKDTLDLYADIAKGELPAVSFVKPSGLVDGHPASSKMDLFEGFAKKIVDAVRAQPSLWKDTVILITVDEGGGYYDSGYVQPLDFFGDGTRIPLIAVSRFTQPGHISHDYTDHVSILKFIERNWDLSPLTRRSRDNLPNPEYGPASRYAPVNGPAIGDLFDLFDFGS